MCAGAIVLFSWVLAIGKPLPHTQTQVDIYIYIYDILYIIWRFEVPPIEFIAFSLLKYTLQ